MSIRPQFTTYHYRADIVSFGITNNGVATVNVKPMPNKPAITSITVRPVAADNVTVHNWSVSNPGDGSRSINVNGPQTLCVEINGDALTPILIFANPIETTSPQNPTYFFLQVWFILLAQ